MPPLGALLWLFLHACLQGVQVSSCACPCCLGCAHILMQPLTSAGEGWQLGEDEERDTEPTPLRRPKRFDDWGGGGSGGGDEQWPRRLEGGGRPQSGGAQSGAAEGPSQEQLEQQRRARQLDSISRKLEKNGAQVGVLALLHALLHGT